MNPHTPQPSPLTPTLREAAQAVVSGWIDDESGMETFDPDLIDTLARAIERDYAALAPKEPREDAG